MQSLTLFTFVCLCIVGAFGDAQQQALFTTSAVAVTSSALDSSTGFTSTVINAPTTYDASTSNAFSFTINTTYSGTLVGTVYALVSFSGAGKLDNGAFCDNQRQLSIVGSSDSNSRIIQFNYNSELEFTAAGSYTATVSLSSSTGRSYSNQATFPFTVSAVAAAVAKPTVATFSMAASQRVPPNITFQLNNAGDADYAQLYFLATTGNQGIVWFTECLLTNGACVNGDFSDFTASQGGFCGDQFLPEDPVGISISGVDFQKDAPVQLRSIEIYHGAYGTLRAVYPGSSITGNTVFTSTNGDSDNVPPTCSSATFQSPTLSTGNSQATIGLVLGCTDPDSRVKASGAILRFTATSTPTFTTDFEVSDNGLSHTVNVPLHSDGDLSVIGVYAIDGAGNAVLYGSCGGAIPSLALQTVCGGSGGSSSASALMFSLYAIVLSAFVVLFN